MNEVSSTTAINKASFLEIEGLTDAAAPVFRLDDLTWGDEQGAMVANSVLLHADAASAADMKSAFETLEGILQRTVVAIPMAWVVDAAMKETKIDWSKVDSFRLFLRRKTFALLNQAMFAEFSRDEKK